MTWLLAYAIVAFLIGLVAFWRQPSLPRAWGWLAVAAFPQLLHLLGYHIPLLLIVTIVALALWSWVNRSLIGVPIVALGLGMNLSVMALHGGLMPISQRVLQAAQVAATPGELLAGSKDVVVDSSRWWFLSDWIYLPLGGPYAIIASLGDVIVVAGILVWLFLSPRKGSADVHTNRSTHRDSDGTDDATAARIEQPSSSYAVGVTGRGESHHRREPAA